MDLLRSSIKSLLFDFPPEEVVKYLDEPSYKDDKGFYDIVGELNTWSERGFTLSEISLLNQVLRSEWLVNQETGFSESAPYHPFERIFLILRHCGDLLLDTTRHEPKVKFKHLLRWRELTLAIGEDTLILPTLAYNDVDRDIERDAFIWPNTLDHNDVQLNALLDSTLSDTHFHLNAGCDVFEFNWLVVMNNPRAVVEGAPGFMGKGRRRSYDRVRRYHALNLSLGEWTLIASWLRALLMEFITDPSMNPQVDINILGSLTEVLPSILLSRTEVMIERFLQSALLTSDRAAFDYAITDFNTRNVSPDQLTDVYMVHHGERWLIYVFLKGYFGGDERYRRFSPLVYLYLLIKNKIRREFIQNNELRGFENFQIYQSLKQHFFKFSAAYKSIYEIAFRYAVQSAIGRNGTHFLEARVVPGAIGLYQNLDYTTSIFGNKEVIVSNAGENVTLVAHFIKKQDMPSPVDIRFIRHQKLRRSLRKGLKDLIKGWERNGDINTVSRLVGIDAASSELGCRPEVFAPVFKEAVRRGIPNITYHVGEDFYDIVDGLRAIDEAIEFLLPPSGGRIGHAIALGIDVRKYYHDRHRYIVISCQDLLDNIVWMKYKAMKLDIPLKPETLLFIKTNYAQLVEQLGYGAGLNDYHYWESMGMRKEDPLLQIDKSGEKILPTPERVLDVYWFQTETYIKGKHVRSIRLPVAFVEDVVRIQERMLEQVADAGIFIETNPTSNLRIGGFDKYSDLPLLRFHSPDESGHKLPVSINTDDKGVFSTSLKNEFSLIAAALRKERDGTGKRRYSDLQIIDYLKRIAGYGNISRFAP